MSGAPPPADPPDPQALLRSRGYVQILILAAIIGVPISAAAYGFLALVDHLQGWLFTDLPETLGFDAAPTWWPLPLLALSRRADRRWRSAACRGPEATRRPTASRRPARCPRSSSPACCSPRSRR